MSKTQVATPAPTFVFDACVLPDVFVRWQLDTRRAMLDSIAQGGHPRRFAAHLPVMITFTVDGTFPLRAATKGGGLVPRDEVLDRYIHLLEETLSRCRDRPWQETIADRVAAVRALLDHLEDIDRRRLGFLEIFRAGTYANLQRDARVVLHYTGDGPNYPSFQINGYAETLRVNLDDPRARYIALARRMFEEAPFHLQQPGYAAAYLVWVHQVLDKTPRSLILHQHDRSDDGQAARGFAAVGGLGSAVGSRSVLTSEASPAVTFREVLVPLDNSKQ